MPLNKIPIGKPITEFPAGSFNTLIDLANTGAGFGRTPGRDQQRPDLAKNTSGGDAPMGAIIRLTGCRDLDNAIVPTFDKPNGTLESYYGILLAPCANNALAEYVVFDPARAYFLSSDGTPAAGEMWGIEPSQWYLRKGRYGFKIIGNPQGTGATARVSVQQLPVDAIVGKPSSAISAGTSGSVVAYTTAISGAAISGLTVDAIAINGAGTSDLVTVERAGETWRVTSVGDGKVKVNATDTLAYLEDQQNDHTSGVYSSSNDIVIKTETNSGKIRYFFDVSAISGYSGSGKMALIIDAGVPKWVTIGTC